VPKKATEKNRSLSTVSAEKWSPGCVLLYQAVEAARIHWFAYLLDSTLALQAVEHFHELIGGGAVDYVAAAGVGGFAKQQLAAAVAVDVYGVD
jgi:hypothetical protein